MTPEPKDRKEMTGREDVSLLVRSFYTKIRQEDTLGPIFNAIIEDWEEHFEKLTDFWESSLFFVRRYYGNPMLAHIAVDQKMENRVEMAHFGIWLNLWTQTIDEYFVGEVAERAKANARRMSTNLFMKIYEHRPDKTGTHP